MMSLPDKAKTPSSSPYGVVKAIVPVNGAPFVHTTLTVLIKVPGDAAAPTTGIGGSKVTTRAGVGRWRIMFPIPLTAATSVTEAAANDSQADRNFIAQTQ
jgi:hypothetical protein